MRITHTALAALAMATAMLATVASPAQAGFEYGCHSCVQTFLSVIVRSGSHGTPNPTRNGDFIGHFDANGVPQSIVEPSDTHEELVEGPCVPVERKYDD